MFIWRPCHLAAGRKPTTTTHVALGARAGARSSFVQFAAVRYTVSEGDGAVKLAVVRSGALDEEVGRSLLIVALHNDTVTIVHSTRRWARFASHGVAF